MPRRPRVPLAPLGFVAITVAAQGGCVLLFALSQFGFAPLPGLPLAVVALLGALATGPLLAAARPLATPTLVTTLMGALAANLVAAGLLAPVGGEARYLLAPLAGAALALGTRAVAPRPELTSAMILYTVCTLLANYTFDSFLPLGGALVNVGTLFFGVTFTQRDRIHRFGRRWAYLTIALAASANVALALALGTPLRYVAVAFAAIVLSESADTEIYGRLVRRPWLARVAASNAVSAPLDTAVFTLLAFAGDPVATPAWLLRVIGTDVAVKFASSMVAAVGLWPRARAVRAAR